MKIQKRIAVASLAAALLMGFTFSHNAQARSDAEKGGAKVELTQEQRSLVKSIWEKERAATADARKALESKWAELETILKDATPDKARIQALATEIGELNGKIISSRANAHAEMMKAGIPVAKTGKKDFGDRGGKFGKPDGERKKFDKQKKDRGDRPELTEEQRGTARKIIDESRAATAEVRKELKAKMDSLGAALKRDTVDSSVIESLSKEIGELRGKLLAADVDARAKLKEAGLPDSLLRRDIARDAGKIKRPGKKDLKEERPGNHN